MLVHILIFFTHQLSNVHTALHQKPVASKIWSERCKKNSYMLNDCNWCTCGEDHNYKCKARICEEVDMFGHFKDTIKEIDVGMEGHGSWRSTSTPCEPGLQYRRGTVHCVCDEDGNWPNPVCRDLLRILHSVEITKGTEESTSQDCSPTKLYLVGCNACFCPSTGKLDAKLCTNRTCTDDDPALAPLEPKEIRKSLKIKRKNNEELEIYASCKRHKIYTLGCRKCTCLTNNRLICDDCVHKNKRNVLFTLCSGLAGKILKMGCNLCKCLSDKFMYCTTRKCIPNIGLGLIVKNDLENYGRLVEAPVDDQDCVPGTSYERDCRICNCKQENQQKVFQCTIKPCSKTSLGDITGDCVVGTTYESDCLICECEVIDGTKYQTCKVNSKCNSSLVLKEARTENLDSLHGYCEPLHIYKKGCNTCVCLTNGKIVKCTTRDCIARYSEPVAVDIIPLQRAEHEPCPEGFSYNIDCNICFCLSNGNSLCTTANCDKRKKLA